MRTLAKVGLVELDEADQARPAAAPAAPVGDVDMAELERMLAEEGDIPSEGGADVDALIAGGAAPAAAPTAASVPQTMMVEGGVPPVGATLGASGGAIAEGKPFEEIYAMANIAQSPFPAEKMIKMLDGLRAMDPNTRKAAVMAMDAADETWSVDDSVLDAQRKIQALQNATASMAETVNQAAAQTATDIQAQETYQTQATDSIRRQIADLETLLQEELTKVAEEKAGIDSRLRGTREAFERETARLSQEIQKLQEIAAVFGGAGTAVPGSS